MYIIITERWGDCPVLIDTGTAERWRLATTYFLYTNNNIVSAKNTRILEIYTCYSYITTVFAQKRQRNCPRCIVEGDFRLGGNTASYKTSSTRSWNGHGWQTHNVVGRFINEHKKYFSDVHRLKARGREFKEYFLIFFKYYQYRVF